MYLARAEQLHALGTQSRERLSDLNDEDDDRSLELAWNEHRGSKRRDKMQTLRAGFCDSSTIAVL